MEILVETKKIGGSLGIILPKSVVEKENLKVKEKVRVEVRKGHNVGELLGLFKGWSRSTEEIIRDSKKGWK